MKAPLRQGHQLRLLEGAAELFPALIQAMDGARHLIHLETYIFDFADSALDVARALERAARRGVTVRLVMDGVGTPTVPEPWPDRLTRAGVQWRMYVPLGRVGLLIPSRWRRLHRKLCVVDGVVGFCGGINLIDDLNDLSLGRLTAPRLDFSLQVQGPLVSDMLVTMERLWWRLQALRRVRQHEFRAAWKDLHDHLPVWEPRADQWPGQGAALLWRDNLRHRHDIERAYLKAIGEAREEVVIANAYLIPGRKMRRALTLAAERGVRVRLLLQGKYEHFFQYHAARPVYATLLKAGIEILEYAPSVLHAKVAVIDRRWATVGSSNLDPLSLLLAREANVVTRSSALVGQLYRRLDQLMFTQGVRVDAETLRSRPRRQRLLDRIAFALMRAVLFLTGYRY